MIVEIHDFFQIILVRKKKKIRVMRTTTVKSIQKLENYSWLYIIFRMV